jgi:gamma-glutamyl hercynylcysteine S-oxide synthase
MLEDVYANRWHDRSYQLWTIVNRTQNRKTGMLMKLPVRSGMRIFDLFRGVEIPADGDSTNIMVDLLPRGLGAILVVEEGQVRNELEEFVKIQKKRFAEIDMQAEVHAIRENLAQRVEPAMISKVPENMVLIERIPETIEISYRQRECGFYRHDQYKAPPDRIHQTITFKRPAEGRKYAIDLTPVTNREYYRFLARSGYKPADTANFLKHWVGGKPARRIQDHPVVYVSLEDARAYAEWAGKRLPAEEEWQIAAQGNEKNVYPWGNSFLPENCNAGQYGGTTPVKKFPEGRSPYGCYDMCGNTWEWTESERSDGHTRYAILKGGSWFKAEGSDWYFEGGPQPARHAAKYILFWPGMDRSPVIGFRCVAAVE